MSDLYQFNDMYYFTELLLKLTNGRFSNKLMCIIIQLKQHQVHKDYNYEELRVTSKTLAIISERNITQDALLNEQCV